VEVIRQKKIDEEVIVDKKKKTALVDKFFKNAHPENSGGGAGTSGQVIYPASMSGSLAEDERAGRAKLSLGRESMTLEDVYGEEDPR
jgi:hypothetical protein